VQKQLAEVEQKIGEQNPNLKSDLAGAQSELANILNKKATVSDEMDGLQEAYTALASALHVLEGGDRAVPSQAIAVYKESSQRIKAGIAEWTTFKQTKLPQLNHQLSDGSLAPIAISEIEQEVQFFMSR
jgi:hypothetical protein